MLATASSSLLSPCTSPSKCFNRSSFTFTRHGQNTRQPHDAAHAKNVRQERKEQHTIHCGDLQKQPTQSISKQTKQARASKGKQKQLSVYLSVYLENEDNLILMRILIVNDTCQPHKPYPHLQLPSPFLLVCFCFYFHDPGGHFVHADYFFQRRYLTRELSSRRFRGG